MVLDDEGNNCGELTLTISKKLPSEELTDEEERKLIKILEKLLKDRPISRLKQKLTQEEFSRKLERKIRKKLKKRFSLVIDASTKASSAGEKTERLKESAPELHSEKLVKKPIKISKKREADEGDPAHRELERPKKEQKSTTQSEIEEISVFFSVYNKYGEKGLNFQACLGKSNFFSGLFLSFSDVDRFFTQPFVKKALTEEIKALIKNFQEKVPASTKDYKAQKEALRQKICARAHHWIQRLQKELESQKLPELPPLPGCEVRRVQRKGTYTERYGYYVPGVKSNQDEYIGSRVASARHPTQDALAYEGHYLLDKRFQFFFDIDGKKEELITQIRAHDTSFGLDETDIIRFKSFQDRKKLAKKRRQARKERAYSVLVGGATHDDGDAPRVKRVREGDETGPSTAMVFFRTTDASGVKVVEQAEDESTSRS
jgi:hypothetical protein